MNRPSLGAWFARRGWAHALLLTGAAIFLFPFVWMLLTSVKTDEEVAEGRWLPAVPRFRAASPYLRDAVEVHKPANVSEDTWERRLPALRERAAAAVVAWASRPSVPAERLSPVVPTAGPLGRDAQATIASVLLDRLTPRLPSNAWSGSDAELTNAWDALLTPDAIAAAVDDRTARLELLALQLRTTDASIHNLFDAATIARDWKVSGGGGSLALKSAAAVLPYDFSRDASPVTLRADFDFPCEPAQLYKLILTLRPDDSWHAVDATLDVGGEQGGRWVTTHSTPLAQNRAMTIILQPPGFEDDTLQPKIWVPMKRVSGIGDRVSGEDQASSIAPKTSADTRSPIPDTRRVPATLTIRITHASTPRAILAKATRNYVRAFHAVPFWRYVANSVLLVGLTTLGTLFSSTFVAYAFARLRWPGRSVAMLLLLSTMMLPQQVTMVPTFLIWRKIGWYNTLNPLWVPSFCGVAFFIFLMTQHMKTIPKELEESARVDGLNALQTWYYIILPQVKPAAAAVAVMTFMWSWNEFLSPLIYLRDQTRFPLSLGLFAMRVENFGDWPLIMAGNVLMTLPVILLFFLCQRYFIQGMTMSGMKG